MYDTLLPIVAPVFLIAAAGYTWVKLGQEFPSKPISALVMNLAAPCLVFSTLTTLEFQPEAFVNIAVAGLITVVAAAALGYVVLLMLRRSHRAFLPSLTFPNAGNMGLAVCLLTFGDEGLALGVVLFALWMTGNFVFGSWVSSGQMTVQSALRTPILYAVPGAIALQLLSLQPPEWIATSTRLVGSITIPLMLITLGASLARLEVRSVKSVGVLAIARFTIGLAAGFGVASLLDLDGTARGVLTLQAAMPPAVINYVFAQRFEREPEEVAAMLLLATVASFLTLPLLIAFAVAQSGI